MRAAEEYLNRDCPCDEAAQREHLHAETDSELAEDVIWVWALEDIDAKPLIAAFVNLRRQLAMNRLRIEPGQLGGRRMRSACPPFCKQVGSIKQRPRSEGANGAANFAW